MAKKMAVRREYGFPTVQGRFIKYVRIDGSQGMYFEPEIETVRNPTPAAPNLAIGGDYTPAPPST